MLATSVAFRASAARSRLYDRHVTWSKGLGKLDTGVGKKGKSRGGELQGGSCVWLASIEMQTDEDKKALLRAATILVKETLGLNMQTLWAHYLVSERRRAKLHIKVKVDDALALAIVQPSSADDAKDALWWELREEVQRHSGNGIVLVGGDLNVKQGGKASRRGTSVWAARGRAGRTGEYMGQMGWRTIARVFGPCCRTRTGEYMGPSSAVPTTCARPSAARWAGGRRGLPAAAWRQIWRRCATQPCARLFPQWSPL